MRQGLQPFLTLVLEGVPEPTECLASGLGPTVPDMAGLMFDQTDRAGLLEDVPPATRGGASDSGRGVPDSTTRDRIGRQVQLRGVDQHQTPAGVGGAERVLLREGEGVAATATDQQQVAQVALPGTRQPPR